VNGLLFGGRGMIYKRIAQFFLSLVIVILLIPVVIKLGGENGSTKNHTSEDSGKAVAYEKQVEEEHPSVIFLNLPGFSSEINENGAASFEVEMLRDEKLPGDYQIFVASIVDIDKRPIGASEHQTTVEALDSLMDASNERYLVTITFNDPTKLSPSYTARLVAIQDGIIQDQLDFNLYHQPPVEEKTFITIIWESVKGLFTIDEWLIVRILIIFLLVYWFNIQIWPLFVGIFEKPRLDIEPFDEEQVEKIGSAISVIMEEEIKNFAPEKGIFWGHLRKDDLSIPELPSAIKSGSKYVEIFYELIAALFPPKMISVNGYVHKPGKLGCGLTVEIIEKRSRKFIDKQTFWEKDYFFQATQTTEDTETISQVYYDLTKVAVVWLLFTISKHLGERFTPYGITSWKSFAYLQAGRMLDGKKDYDTLRFIFTRALREAEESQSHNWEAVLDLAELAQKHGRDSIANSRLRYLCDHKDELTGNLIWFKAMYQSGARHAHSGNFQETVRICEEIDKNWITVNRKIRDFPELAANKENLDAIHRMSQIMRAGTLIDLNLKNKDEAEKIVSQLENLEILGYRTHYNLACYYSILGSKEEIEKKKKEYFDKAQTFLELGLRWGGGQAKWAKEDPTLEAIRASRKEEFDQIVSEAPKVPVEPSKQEKKKEEKKAEDNIMHVVLAEPLEDGIALLPGITEELIEAFNNLSIFTWSDLLANGIDPNSRWELMKKAGVDEEHLYWWLNLCDLTRIPDLSIESAVLLESMGEVDTVKELRRRKASSLNKKLKNRISEKKLSEWIEAAKNLIPSLEY
jgi:hypothetical protein